jgi:molecular chaperone DnaK (HSP70)
LSACSEPNVGARDFDKLLFDHLVQHFKTTYKLDVLSNKKACVKLYLECARLKIVLSANQIARYFFFVTYTHIYTYKHVHIYTYTHIHIYTHRYQLESFMDTDCSGSVTRAQFEELAVHFYFLFFFGLF